MVRVELRFDGAHQGDFVGGAHLRQPAFFQCADAVFGGDGAVVVQHMAVHGRIDGFFAAVHAVAQFVGEKGVVVQAAVAQMPEDDQLDVGMLRDQIAAALFDKLGGAGNGDGNVVFDAGAERALGGGDVFAQGP